MTMRLICLLSSFLFLSLNAFATEIESRKISEHAHILKGKSYGTNIGVLQHNGSVVLIDPMPGEKHLEDLLKEIISISNSPIVYIAITHTHSDHSGGNAFFINAGAKIVEQDYEKLGLRHVTVKSHSSIDNIFYEPNSNIIFVGDVFDTSWHPTFYAGGVEGFQKAIDAILKLGDENTLIIPGHGEPSDKTHLIEFRNNTLLWMDKITQFHQLGMDEETMFKQVELRELVAKFDVNGASNFLPDKAYKRFIQRSVQVLKKSQKNKSQ